MDSSMDNTKNRINNLINQNYYSDLKYNIGSKSRLKIISDWSDGLAQLLMGISVVLAFAAGYFDHYILSFIAGCMGTISMVVLKFSSYAMKESKERTDQVNLILRKLGIDTIPIVNTDSIAESIMSILDKKDEKSDESVTINI